MFCFIEVCTCRCLPTVPAHMCTNHQWPLSNDHCAHAMANWPVCACSGKNHCPLRACKHLHLQVSYHCRLATSTHVVMFIIFQHWNKVPLALLDHRMCNPLVYLTMTVAPNLYNAVPPVHFLATVFVRPMKSSSMYVAPALTCNHWLSSAMWPIMWCL